MASRDFEIPEEWALLPVFVLGLQWHDAYPGQAGATGGL